MKAKQDEILVENLTVHYDGTPALWDVSVKIPRGKFVAVIGPNGAGKSSFMKALLGLTETVSGRVLFHHKKAKEIRGKIAYIPQKELIDFTFPMTVKELVLMGAFPRLGLFRWIGKKDEEAAMCALDQVGMREFAARQIGELSGGQQQRVFLARALLQDADYYLLDEALSGVDHVSEQVIIEILKKMQQAGKTIIMVHHDLNTIERYFDWIVCLNIRLVKAGATSEVFTRETLQEAYGKSFEIYSEAIKLQHERVQ